MPVVYMATNKSNGHRYIGAAKNTLKRRRSRHEWEARTEYKTLAYMPFIKALKKYGPEEFDWETLEEHDSHQEALDGEIWWIALLEPEYNVTKGGQGIIGIEWSKERRERMSRLLKGRKRSEEVRARISAGKKGKPNLALLGKSHSPERVEKTRERGIQNRDKWLERSWMGPAASSKPVRCLDDGQVYKSAAAAARAYGVSTGALSEHCSGARNRASVGGHRFAYVDRPPPENRIDTRRKFTNDQVAMLRAASATTSIYRLAKDNGVSWSVMRDLVEGRSYKQNELST